MSVIIPSKPGKESVICWFSGGVTSAIACKLAIELYGKEQCRVIFIDTFNEDEDTYRFLLDCEKWYDTPIEIAFNPNYKNIKEVWRKFLGMNFANGAICSSELKRAVRVRFLKENDFSFNVFGYDVSEPKRAAAMALNYPQINPIYPLLLYGYSKKKCISMLNEAGIDIPRAYKLGLHNNNCLKTGCVQGGIGYWQLIQTKLPRLFDDMAEEEHVLTNLKGHPVTMLKDQSNEAKETGRFHVFLKPHPNYPDHKDISMMKGRKPEPLTDCNGFCGINDLQKRSKTESELFKQ